MHINTIQPSRTYWINEFVMVTCLLRVPPLYGILWIYRILTLFCSSFCMTVSLLRAETHSWFLAQYVFIYVEWVSKMGSLQVFWDAAYLPQPVQRRSSERFQTALMLLSQNWHCTLIFVTVKIDWEPRWGGMGCGKVSKNPSLDSVAWALKSFSVGVLVHSGILSASVSPSFCPKGFCSP